MADEQKSKADNLEQRMLQASEPFGDQLNRTWEEVKAARQVLQEYHDSTMLRVAPVIENVVAELQEMQEPGWADYFAKWQMEFIKKLLNEVPDVEELPPFALEIWQTLKELISIKHCYLMHTAIEDWGDDPQRFRQLRIAAYDHRHLSLLPVCASIIYRKSDGHVATEEELLSAYAASSRSSREDQVRYHGIELSIDHFIIQSPSGEPFYAKELFEELQKTQACKAGFERMPPDKAFDRNTFYAPQTPAKCYQKSPA